MDLYPLRFLSIHSHCHEDGIIFHSISKEFQRFWAIVPLRDAFKKNQERAGTRKYIIYIKQVIGRKFESHWSKSEV
jgi:hypothetical protein